MQQLVATVSLYVARTVSVKETATPHRTGKPPATECKADVGAGPRAATVHVSACNPATPNHPASLSRTIVIGRLDIAATCRSERWPLIKSRRNRFARIEGRIILCVCALAVIYSTTTSSSNFYSAGETNPCINSYTRCREGRDSRDARPLQEFGERSAACRKRTQSCTVFDCLNITQNTGAQRHFGATRSNFQDFPAENNVALSAYGKKKRVKVIHPREYLEPVEDYFITP